MTTQSPPRPLRRPVNGRVIVGVCRGLADYTGLDVAVIRLLAVALAVLGGGAGVVLYAAAWLLIPAEDQTQSPAERLIGR